MSCICSWPIRDCKCEEHGVKYSPFDDELQMGDKRSAWKDKEILRLGEKVELFYEVIKLVKATDINTCTLVVQKFREVEESRRL